MISQLDNASAETREFISSEHGPFINGERIITSEKEVIIDPSTAETIGEFSVCRLDETNTAINAARSTFDSGIWQNLTPAERARTLWKVADLIEANQKILGELESIDGGKPIGPAMQGEVPAAAEAFRYHAGWCTKIEGRTFKPSIPGLNLEGSTYLEPVGVAGLITPWNGPLVMAAWKLAPALAAGCSCVLKPSENTVLSTLYLGQLLEQGGLPAGVVNIVTGGGQSVGSVLSQSTEIDKISFTGSTATARHIIEGAKENFKKVSLELGGKSPVLIFEDADMAAAVQGAADGIFSNAGQVCVAGSRILVHRSIFDEFAQNFINLANSIKLGLSLAEDTQMGPLISHVHRQSVAKIVEQSLLGNAELLCGGKSLDQTGFYFSPTVIASSDTRNCAVLEEIFGPVAIIMPFDDEEQAVAMANNSQYGLAASVWTENTSRARRITQKIRSGIVWINCHGIPDMAMPIGGYKNSGWGREHGWRGIEAYLEHKSVMQRLL